MTARSRRAGDIQPEPLYILGAGMHPWGKWGNDFTEYGCVLTPPTCPMPWQRLG
jgi:hypothetical protein